MYEIVDTLNVCEPWACFRVYSVLLINCAKIVLGDKQTQSPSKKCRVEGRWIFTYVDSMRPLKSLQQHATPNTKIQLDYFS